MEEAAILRIIDISRLIQAATKHAVSQDTCNAPSYPPTPFAFPPLPDLTPELHNIGLSARAVSLLVEVFRSKCARLQTIHRQELSKMSSILGSVPLYDKFQAYVYKSYMQKVASFQSEFLRCARLQCNKMRSIATAKRFQGQQTKTIFNHDYVPVLEKYFEHNAYPSAADRALMARKSMMSERQIEVWFQNHRNRARKEGKTLNRLRASDPLPPNLSFESLDEKMGDLIRSESERQSMVELDESDSDNFEPDEKEPPASTTTQASGPVGPQVLDPPVPSHAFPSPYVPPSYTFLNAKSRQGTFPSPTWPRKPVTHSTRTSTLPISFDDFVDLFARMTVREGLRKQNRRRIAPLPGSSRKSPSPASTDRSAATCAITTIICPGRHPAFIPSPPPHRRALCSPIPATLSAPSIFSPRANPSPSHPLPSRPQVQTISKQPQASTSSVPTSSAPLSHTASPSTTPRRRRKSPPLPRRMPGSPPVAQPHSHKSRNSPYAHPYSTLSRNSSSTSIASSTSARSSSSSSTSSSTLATPSHPSISLPISSSPMHASKSPSSAISLSNQSFSELFGNSFGSAGMSKNVFNFNFGMAHPLSVVHAHS